MTKRVCKHPESLIYFDILYAGTWSWQVCDTCGEAFNYEELQAPATNHNDYTRLQSLDGGTIHDHV